MTETLYAIALTRLCRYRPDVAMSLYTALGSARAVYEHRADICDVVPDCSRRLADTLTDWDEPLRRAEAETAFAARHAITVLTPADDSYPRRLRECADAPLVIYYRGTADLNGGRIVSVVGTRRCTVYGQDLIRRFTADLRSMCPAALIVSGLAYGVDICAHRESLACGFETVGVLAHGLDMIYPSAHRATALEMMSHGGLLTEFMSCSKADKVNFVSRNRIVAGMADATVVVESAARGGSLITAGIARGYGRDVFAFPGAVGAPSSEGCNNLIRDNGAALISSAADLVNAMGWEDETLLQRAKSAGIERSLFPDLDSDEQRIVGLLQTADDLQLNIIAARTNMPVGKVVSVLFGLEMKGVVRPLAGGMYHLLK